MGIPRQCETQQIHYLRRDFTYADSGFSNGLLVGTVPAGSVLTSIHAKINTVFNAGTANPIAVGTTGTGTNLMSATDVGATALGFKTATDTGATAGRGVPITQDQDIFVSYIPTGTAATTGSGTVVIGFIPLSNGG